MAIILQAAFSKFIFLYNNYCILIQNSLKWVPNGPIDNKSVLV